MDKGTLPPCAHHPWTKAHRCTLVQIIHGQRHPPTLCRSSMDKGTQMHTCTDELDPRTARRRTGKEAIEKEMDTIRNGVSCDAW
eukprot:scaffold519_cov331-Pavlova_lutheri.AAC.23